VDVTTAAEVLTSSSMRIVLVVDKENRLLGTITDGDIRRALMAGSAMSSLATSVMQKNPIAVNQGDSRRKALQIMREKDLLHLPVLDAKGVVVGLETVRDLLFKEQRPNPVLLMAGGFGKRLYPLTREVPKPLLPVGEKPILQTILEQLAEGGFSQFFLAVHYRSEQVRAHFGDGSKWGVRIEYLEERQPLGTAGALSLLDQTMIDAPLLMMNGDLLTRLDFGQLVDFHGEHGGLATMCVREYDFQIPYGVVHGDGDQVTDIIEKPVQKFFVNAGIYILEPDLLGHCRPDEAIDMPDLLRQVVNDGRKVSMFPIHEYWLDIGRMEEYERAQVEGS
jgi:dTDP-glucose pyrophosphorylase